MKNFYVYPFSILLLTTSVLAHNQFQHESTNKAYPVSSKVSDATITTHVKNKLKADSQLCNSKVNVSSNEGIVCISGSVEYYIQAANMVATAFSVRGVKDIDICKLQIEESKISSKLMLKDDYITAKVEGALIRENLFGISKFEGINIKTENGMVYLSGCVNDPIKARNIVATAESVPDVLKVVHSIKIGQ